MHKRSTVTDLAYAAVFAALIIALAFVSIPVGAAGVPIVLQNAAVILSALVLGPRRAFFSVALFLFLGVLGLPVLAGGRSTLTALAGPTVGYLVGYLVSTIVAGTIAYRARPSRRAAQIGFFTLAGIAGLACHYGFGVLGLVIRTDMNIVSAVTSQMPYLIPDLAKLAAVIAIALGVHAAFPDLLERGRR